MPGFTHLHTVSGFSARYGASHPERLAERAFERGMDALALTDRDTLAGTVRFAKACAKAGVRPLFGAELAVAAPEPEAGRTDTSVRRDRRRVPVRGGAFVDESAARVTFLARDGARGWADLCRLVSAAHTAEGSPLLSWSDNHADGLTVLLGPDSDVGRALAAGRPDRAARLLAPWREVYGDALCLEAVWHGREGTGPGSLRLASRTVGFAAEQGVRPVLSNAVRYADPGQGEVADVLDAARRLVPIGAGKELDSGEAWLKDAGAMRHAAERIVESAGFRRDTAHRLLEQTRATAAECLVDPEDDLGMGAVHFPEPHLVGAGRRTAQRALASRAAAGMVRRGYDRMPGRREYWERMHHELDIIAHHGFASYFLTVAQVVDDVRHMGIRVAARGSGAGSLVNHLLGIAHADPVEHGLLMERFLSRERVVLPDIDIDVESARRLEVYRAIIGRFGTERVATVAMPETYRVRHAIRDVGAALSMDPAEIDRVAKSFPHIRARDARAALEELPELKELAGEREKYGKLWELVEGLDALPRGVAMHPCGVLLSDASLLSRTPVVPTSGEGFPMAQFDKDDVEDLGLLKLDVLGVRMQSAMAHAVAEVKRATGTEVDLDAVPEGDPATYRMIRSAETLGCFQIESPGQLPELLGLLEEFTPVVEALPPDGALADLRGAERYFGRDAVELASVIRVRALALYGVDCVIGAGPGPMLARMALRDARPGLTRAVPVGEERDFLAGKPVAALPGVGAATARTLCEYGLDTLGRVAIAPLSTLQRLVGARTGRELHEKANGVDRGRVVPNGVSRSLAADRPFDRDELDPDRHRRALLSAAGELGARLRAVDKVCRTLTLTVRYADRSATTRSRTLKEPTAHSAALTRTAYDMYEALGLQRARVRTIALRAEGLAPAEQASHQLTFDPVDEKVRRIEEVADRARAKFGPRAVMPGSLAA
ncbi:Error-prone DNA polymerase [Streptomyces tendae]